MLVCQLEQAYWIGEYAGATLASLFSKVIVLFRNRQVPEFSQQKESAFKGMTNKIHLQGTVLVSVSFIL